MNIRALLHRLLLTGVLGVTLLVTLESAVRPTPTFAPNSDTEYLPDQVIVK